MSVTEFFFHAATRRATLFAACICVLVPGLSKTAAAEAWPTTKYVVVQPNYYVDGHERLDADQVEKIETRMQAYAEEYQRTGWRAPHHEFRRRPLDAYGVFVIEYERQGPPKFQIDCYNKSIETRILIDPREWNANIGTANEAKNWQDLAHEMFHSIQHSYAPFKDCPGGIGIGDWIAEGTAEAMGIEMARRVANVRPFSACQIGVRPYNTELYLKDDAPDLGCNGAYASYYTNSFWQYLAEWRSKKSAPTPTRTHQPDYRYLQLLFANPPSSFDSASEYEWLHKSLQQHFGFGLREAYTRFVAAFSGYINARKGFYRGGATGDPDLWHEQNFGPCKVISRMTGAPQPVTMSLEPMSAQCLKVITPADGSQPIEIVARGDVARLPDLTISTENGKQFVRALMKPAAKPDRATFNFVIGGAQVQEDYFIVANAANDPSANAAQTVELTITNANSQSSSATESRRDTKTAQRRKDTSDDAYDDEYAANKGVDRWQGTVTQIRVGSICDKAFVDRICGERTKIDLALTPDQLTAIRSALKNRSTLDTARRAGQIVDMNGISDLMEHERRLAETEGSMVQIEIPRIEYGFTGSFSNAFIRMNKPLSAEKDSDHYTTKGPEWQGSCQDGRHAYSGSVTIEEASVEVLRGRFAGDMVDPDLRDKYYCRDLPVYRSISGAFAILSPDLGGDAQDAAVDPSAIIDQAFDEAAANAAGVIPPGARDAAKRRVGDAETRRSEASAGSAGAASGCDCRCNRAGQTVSIPGCYEQCETAYQQCTAPSPEQIKTMYDINRSATPEETEAFARMREEIVVWLENEPKRYVRETWLNQFDQAPHYMKKKIYDQIKARYAGG